jgi:hypothetical protein
MSVVEMVLTLAEWRRDDEGRCDFDRQYIFRFEALESLGQVEYKRQESAGRAG